MVTISEWMSQWGGETWNVMRDAWLIGAGAGWCRAIWGDIGAIGFHSRWLTLTPVDSRWLPLTRVDSRFGGGEPWVIGSDRESAVLPTVSDRESRRDWHLRRNWTRRWNARLFSGVLSARRIGVSLSAFGFLVWPATCVFQGRRGSGCPSG